MFGKSIVHQLSFFVLTLIGWHQMAFSQCASPVNTFPFVESFEFNTGGFARSSSDHWEWGTIVPGTKTVITAAASGQRCWVVGGLSGANYNAGLSYLQSPCFDFTNLVNPEVSVNIIWETERNFDGVHLEYSTDQGTTWQLLGSANSNADCTGINWYNNASIRFLGNRPGWSGSTRSGSGGNCQSGNGSAIWVEARHTLSNLAGMNGIVFRFVFGAGTVCNDYEGFALDVFSIRETPPPSGGFTYTCSPNRSVSFSTIPQFCQSGVRWDFGDPNAGSQNTSTALNPIHVFSSAGSFTVTQTIFFQNGSQQVTDTVIRILGATVNTVSPVLCTNDQTGQLQVVPSGGLGSYSISWNTNPVQMTPLISNLGAGNYSVTVSEPGACPVTANIALPNPPPLNIRVDGTDTYCENNDGTVSASVVGGVAPYDFLWSMGAVSPTVSGLAPGTYQVQITDANGCVQSSSNVSITRQQVVLRPRLGADTTLCASQSIRLNPGQFSSYRWQDNSIGQTYLVTTPGVYFVSVRDPNGCEGTDTVRITKGCQGIYFPTAFSPNADGVNDRFGPLGDVAGLTDFSIYIVDRWGNLIYFSDNPLQRWNGQFRNQSTPIGSYVWFCTYRYRGAAPFTQKGIVLVIR
ncbi:MAG: gliding motility-associated C-terminal domain-containing protein [Ferruginibacter sp.]